MIKIDLTKALANVDVEYELNTPIDVQPDWLPYPDCEVVEASFDGCYCYNDPNVEVYGDIFVTVKASCDRCGQPIVKKFLINFDQEYLKYDDSGEHYLYNGSKLDIEPAIREQIIVSMPTSILCSNDCKGLCHKCGCNLNKERCDCN